MVSFTDTAIKQLSNSIDSGDFIRIGVRGGGCSGMSYFMNIVTEFDENIDKLFEFDNLKICIDKKSVFMLSETIVDYVVGLSSSGFKFNNDRATNTCGCGESFSC